MTPAPISDLSRLRERWARLENTIAKLEAQSEAAEDGEVPALVEKILAAKERLKATKLATAIEERRLFNPNAKLKFTPSRVRES